MTTRTVPGFLPSRHGAGYSNRWPDAPALEWRLGPIRVGIGNAADGLCGGMCLVARDHWALGEAGDAEQPAPGSSAFRRVVARQVESFGLLGWVPVRFFLLAAVTGETARSVPGGLRLPSRAEATLRDGWPAIRRALDRGRPVVVGLVREPGPNPVRLTRNHQVLAFGYDVSGRVATIRVYDPNHPGRDDVTVELRVTPGPGPVSERLQLAQSTGEPLLAFFAAG